MGLIMENKIYCSPAVFSDLIKNSEMTTSYIQVINMMKDISSFIPENNINFNNIFISADEASYELKKQEQELTSFRGGLFDFLRKIVNEKNDPEVIKAVASVLKSINSEKRKPGVLRAISSAFKYMSENFSTELEEVSTEFKELGERFFSSGFQENVSLIKADALLALDKAELKSSGNIQLLGCISAVRYNISRYNDDTDHIGMTSDRLASLLRKKERSEFMQLIYDFLMHNIPLYSDSYVMNSITEILRNQSQNDEIKAISPGITDSVIRHFLLCTGGFSSLYHMVLPIEKYGFKVIAEIWIKNICNGSYHMLVVIDLGKNIKTEAEIYIDGKNIESVLYLPDILESSSEKIILAFRKHISDFSYKVTNILSRKYIKQRSLEDVFGENLIKRNGLDVRV